MEHKTLAFEVIPGSYCSLALSGLRAELWRDPVWDDKNVRSDRLQAIR